MPKLLPRLPMFLALLICGCTMITTRPKNVARTVFNVLPEASEPGADDFVTAMDKLTSTHMTGGNTVKLLVNGGEAFPEMLAAIGVAKERVSMETYILRLDEVGTRFRDALLAAAKRGVKVRLLVDDFGSRGLERKELEPITEAGGEVRIFNPVSNWTLLRMNNRNHRKVLVVDGRRAFLGGLNLAIEYDGDGFTHWRDTHLSVEGPAAHEAETIFAESWLQGGTGFIGKNLPIIGTTELKKTLDEPFRLLLGKRPEWKPEEPDAVADVSGGVRARIVPSAPESLDSRILDMYLLAINSARKRVWITNGYFIPPVTLRRAICNAAKRGVDVRMILQGETDEPTTRTISVGFYGVLLKSGVRIYEWPHPILHAKTMVVDGKWTTVGSANLDGRALFLDYEANVEVLDETLARQMERQFLKDTGACRAVTLEDWEKRSLKQKTQELLLGPLEGQF